MTKLHFWSDGDPSCGIGRSETEIELALDGYNAEETADNIAHAKEVLSKALAEIWDNGAVHVATSEDVNRFVTMQAAGIAQGIQRADEDLAMICDQASTNFPPQIGAATQDLSSLELLAQITKLRQDALSQDEAVTTEAALRSLELAYLSLLNLGKTDNANSAD